ncbi:hypothetical protein MAR_022828 [Mya arenaria]|uniref:Uncharacterized protein n=1 Tax=Mya arenaria TaxID=6604 RepID=A0ABY7DQ24_MYAAR|nr:hypothetical protein MAR_022828 [Mya arenaria]
MSIRTRLFEDSPVSDVTSGSPWDEIAAMLTPCQTVNESLDSGIGSSAELSIKLPSRRRHRSIRSGDVKRSLFSGKRPADSEVDDSPAVKKVRGEDIQTIEKDIIHAVERLETCDLLPSRRRHRSIRSGDVKRSLFSGKRPADSEVDDSPAVKKVRGEDIQTIEKDIIHAVERLETCDLLPSRRRHRSIRSGDVKRSLFSGKRPADSEVDDSPAVKKVRGEDIQTIEKDIIHAVERLETCDLLPSRRRHRSIRSGDVKRSLFSGKRPADSEVDDSPAVKKVRGEDIQTIEKDIIHAVERLETTRLFEDSPVSDVTSGSPWDEIAAMLTPCQTVNESLDSGIGSSAELSIKLPSRRRHRSIRSGDVKRSLFSGKRPADSEVDDSPAVKKVRGEDIQTIEKDIIHAVERLETCDLLPSRRRHRSIRSGDVKRSLFSGKRPADSEVDDSPAVKKVRGEDIQTIEKDIIHAVERLETTRLFEDSPVSDVTSGSPWDEIAAMLTPCQTVNESLDSGIGSSAELSIKLPSRRRHRSIRSGDVKRSLFSGKRPADSEVDDSPAVKKVRGEDIQTIEKDIIHAVERLETCDLLPSRRRHRSIRSGDVKRSLFSGKRPADSEVDDSPAVKKVRGEDIQTIEKDIIHAVERLETCDLLPSRRRHRSIRSGDVKRSLFSGKRPADSEVDDSPAVKKVRGEDIQTIEKDIIHAVERLETCDLLPSRRRHRSIRSGDVKRSLFSGKRPADSEVDDSPAVKKVRGEDIQTIEKDIIHAVERLETCDLLPSRRRHRSIRSGDVKRSLFSGKRPADSEVDDSPAVKKVRGEDIQTIEKDIIHAVERLETCDLFFVKK